MANVSSAARAAELAARHGYGKLVAILAARTRDVAGAEDALAEAFRVALEQWPERGVPSAPEAWLLTVARRRAVDAIRQRKRDEQAAQHLVLMEELADLTDGSVLPDRRLELLFACAHPAVDPGARAPLMLQAVLGFDAATIASAFLVAPAAMGQRLVRAKNKIRQAGIGFQVPTRSDLEPRLGAVLDAVYACYAEGWNDAQGADPRRRNLAEEAIFLGRLVADLLPGEPEALGLVALMLHAHARRGARRSPAGEYVPISDQDTALWDAAMIGEAEDFLLRAWNTGRFGRFQLEAAVQSAHNERQTGRPTSWPSIVRLYDTLLELTDSPVTAINRAVAVSQAHGPEAGLAALNLLSSDVRLQDYQPYWAARAELLARTGAVSDARDAYLRAIGLERDAAVRSFLLRRMQMCD